MTVLGGKDFSRLKMEYNVFKIVSSDALDQNDYNRVEATRKTTLVPIFALSFSSRVVNRALKIIEFLPIHQTF
jgi:hypothetical protein